MQDNGKLPNVAALEKRLGDLKDRKDKLMKRYGNIKDEITDLERMQKDIEKRERSTSQRTKSEELE